MPRPFTQTQAAQNRAFLDALAETGNARLAARALGVHRSTYTKRRARCPAFAAEWDAALAAARPHRRRPRAGGIDPSVDAELLAYLAEGWSLRLAAHTCGFAHSSFLARARADPAFAHELKVAARIGRDRLVLADIDAMEGGLEAIGFRFHDRPLPRMSVEEVIHRLYLADPNGAFQRSVRRRRAPPRPLAHHAPAMMRKLHAQARRRHYEATGTWRLPEE